MGNEDQKTGALVLIEFYKEIADVLVNKVGPDHKQITCVSNFNNIIIISAHKLLFLNWFLNYIWEYDLGK